MVTILIRPSHRELGCANRGSLGGGKDPGVRIWPHHTKHSPWGSPGWRRSWAQLGQEGAVPLFFSTGGSLSFFSKEILQNLTCRNSMGAASACSLLPLQPPGPPCPAGCAGPQTPAPRRHVLAQRSEVSREAHAGLVLVRPYPAFQSRAPLPSFIQAHFRAPVVDGGRASFLSLCPKLQWGHEAGAVAGATLPHGGLDAHGTGPPSSTLPVSLCFNSSPSWGPLGDSRVTHILVPTAAGQGHRARGPQLLPQVPEGWAWLKRDVCAAGPEPPLSAMLTEPMRSVGRTGRRSCGQGAVTMCSLVLHLHSPLLLGPIWGSCATAGACRQGTGGLSPFTTSPSPATWRAADTSEMRGTGVVPTDLPRAARLPLGTTCRLCSLPKRGFGGGSGAP
uniref:uncharacterized protein LOC120887426 n=1 Tax=Ictidomys tridecemlineatus TaxID=43179 RepID=UPI001A9FD354|nr:uncharacterized protein LOC120887426 [Ictidomys tridecemlineatus]XP_040133742.1 uncharacterized protein LOC120887426 [Ictidomys tridecemlineatus]